MDRFFIVGTESDDPFAIDIGRYCGQRQDTSDIISLKCFANSEFCPQFLTDGRHEPGVSLADSTVIIVSSASGYIARDALAMRTMLVARAARDNGASRVVLVEPDLFYSAQDRGPRPDQGVVDFERTRADYEKFDGQPFSSRLYAEAIGLAGVDTVVTVHNHSASVGAEFSRCLTGRYHNLSPAPVFAHYVLDSDVVDTADGGSRLLICAPDGGAVEFAREVKERLGLPRAEMIELSKERHGERSVDLAVSPRSDVGLEAVADRDVLILDDMVRTGTTIMQCCRTLREARPRRVVFGVTHYHSSEENRECLRLPVLDEIITTNTIPTILNRDMQGRLRKKMVVLKIERWIARFLLELIGLDPGPEGDVYAVDMSSKNPRWRPRA